jgi:hypothetical protein
MRWLGLGVQHGVGEPPIELFSAAVARRCRWLAMTVRIVGRTADTDVEMVVVIPPRTHLL